MWKKFAIHASTAFLVASAGGLTALAAPASAASCGDYANNQRIGCDLMVSRWSVDEMPCLDSLWTKESSWNHRATNPNDGSYGIPQAHPGNKMASHGADWKTNPATQIRWGLDYIGDRYGSPCGAWNSWQQQHWY